MHIAAPQNTMATHDRNEGGPSERTGAGTWTGDGSIVRVGESRQLATRVLEERKLIHRNDSVRPQADAFRGLRTRLLALAGERNFVTLVASVRSGCGGSFVARNLAAAFAFDEARTALLVDCDAIHPVQHKVLGVDPTNGGLMDYLDGHVANIADVQYETGIPRLRLTPCGSQRETAGEYFSSQRMRTMVDSLRASQATHHLILDGPAALASPDARILSDLADLVVVVAGYGQATIEDIDAAASGFDPAKLAGIVFNDIH